MARTILSPNQTRLLEIIADDKEICHCFYLTGGTALAEFYLHHRLSEDLDFFSENEFDVQAVSVFFKKNKKIIGFGKIDYQQSFNRNLFFVDFAGDIVKAEFTYFPFTEIQPKTEIGDLRIDGALDIAVNKIFTIYQNPRARDFIDVYCLHGEFGFAVGDLAKKAKQEEKRRQKLAGKADTAEDGAGDTSAAGATEAESSTDSEAAPTA